MPLLLVFFYDFVMCVGIAFWGGCVNILYLRACAIFPLVCYIFELRL